MALITVGVRDVRDRLQEADTPPGTVTIERSVSSTTAASAAGRLTIGRLSLDGLRRGQSIKRTYPPAEYHATIDGLQWRPLGIRFRIVADSFVYEIRLPQRLHCEIRDRTGKELLHHYPDGRLAMDEDLGLGEATLLALCHGCGLSSAVSAFYWLTM